MDGTKGFLRNEQYAIALALVEDGEVVLGVMGCPNLPYCGEPGDPSVGGPTGVLFIADQGQSAQQGFGSAEPYIYANEVPDWNKEIAYAYINDAGWENYAESIAIKAEAYGMPGIRIDGNDPLAVYDVTLQAIERARSGERVHQPLSENPGIPLLVGVLDQRLRVGTLRAMVGFPVPGATATIRQSP